LDPNESEEHEREEKEKELGGGRESRRDGREGG
jgi:hypothetical protein